MDIDVSALKALVREKDLSLDLVVETIEQADRKSTRLNSSH